MTADPTGVRDGLLALHAAATWFMTGVIGFVQLVHYPLMAGVGRARFAAYEADHTRRTTWVVGPPMLIEAATALALALGSDALGLGTEAWLGLALLIAVWLSTACLQVPRHRDLHHGFDARVHMRLVRTNWLRVVGWSVRSLLALSWLL